MYRLVHSGKQQSAVVEGMEVLLFGIRSGTRQGVESHVFRVETHRDVATWTRVLVQGAHAAAILVKEVSCRTYTVIFTVSCFHSLCILV